MSVTIYIVVVTITSYHHYYIIYTTSNFNLKFLRRQVIIFTSIRSRIFGKCKLNQVRACP